MLTEKRVEELEKFATDIRIQTIRQMETRGFGHMGGAMSICDLLSVLYGEQMKYDADNPEWEERDWLICSKGHAGPGSVCSVGIERLFPNGLAGYPKSAGNKIAEPLRSFKDTGN